MKVAVINFSGNVGKTTIAGYLLAPRIPQAPIFSVESLNIDASADGIAVERMRGRQFGDLQDQLLMQDHAIVDVGTSNIEDFMKRMQQYHGAHEDFDYFLVPVVKERKQQADTINTIRALASLGVPAEKIRVVFNKVDVDDAVEDDFGAIFGLHVTEKSFTLQPEAVIYHNEIFERLKSVGKSLADIMKDDTDYRAKLKQAKSERDKEALVRLIAIKRLAVSASQNLDDVYKTLFE